MMQDNLETEMYGAAYKKDFVIFMFEYKSHLTLNQIINRLKLIELWFKPIQFRLDILEALEEELLIFYNFYPQHYTHHGFKIMNRLAIMIHNIQEGIKS